MLRETSQGISDEDDEGSDNTPTVDLSRVCHMIGLQILVRKRAKIRNRYNQVPHLTQDTTRESDKHTIKHHKREPRGQPFPSRWPQGINRPMRKHNKHKTEIPANKKTLWKRCDNVLIWLWKRFGKTFIRAFLESFLNVCKTFWYNVTKNVVKTLWQRFGTTLQKTLWKRCDNLLIWLWKSFGKTFMWAFLESFLNVCKTFWKNVAENPFCDLPATFLKQPFSNLPTAFLQPFSDLFNP